ncbi:MULTISPECIES: hypothetical protein [unclassified Rhizobium]|uniref:hypothetical protein n=1 Tax=unclassified Rhizobium TaxID=2613769 RepID=UPI000713B1AB|nr:MULTISPECIES: hypothetical protein [unclassified Rhizobium]KQS87630.1 hypothetical protein ASG42_19615 [Rhizobium sp. Leaf391]KQT07066.1 hypothetical protein ASG50_01160 [Rhizobium sp. Leaf386]KQT95192.1 hypothetical protein ASG68_14425 [Rhizobium sp. Leaf453]
MEPGTISFGVVMLMILAPVMLTLAVAGHNAGKRRNARSAASGGGETGVIFDVGGHCGSDSSGGDCGGGGDGGGGSD